MWDKIKSNQLYLVVFIVSALPTTSTQSTPASTVTVPSTTSLSMNTTKTSTLLPASVGYGDGKYLNVQLGRPLTLNLKLKMNL